MHVFLESTWWMASGKFQSPLAKPHLIELNYKEQNSSMYLDLPCAVE